jgi:hypothetical protein
MRADTLVIAVNVTQSAICTLRRSELAAAVTNVDDEFLSVSHFILGAVDLPVYGIGNAARRASSRSRNSSPYRKENNREIGSIFRPSRGGSRAEHVDRRIDFSCAA